MTLDAYPGDAAILRRKAEQEARAGSPRLNGIALGPDSPMQPARGKATRSTARNSKREEHEIQVALFANVNHHEEQRRRPELAMTFAVPNGGYRSIGTAIRLKLEGVKPGPPDVWHPVPRGGFIGLVIEIKKPGGTISPEQADWLAALERVGWKTAIHTSAEAAFAELTAYIDQSRTTTLE